MRIFTIGFTKKTAQQFFELLNKNEVECLIDIRLRPGGQLSGFAKKEDLRYFLRELNDCDYRHMPELAPTDEILKKYRKNKNWSEYVDSFEALMDKRIIPGTLSQTLFTEKTCCLLCSEATPEQCHRRLVAERLEKYWNNVEVINL